MGQVTGQEQRLEELTHLAMKAAEQGKWNLVAQLYDRRAGVGSFELISPNLAKKLEQIDQWIMARVREVQALAQQQLDEVQQQRRSLKGLKRQWAHHSLIQARYRLSV